MKAYIVIYQGDSCGTDNDSIAAALAEFPSHWKIRLGTWFLYTDKSAQELTSELERHVCQGGTLFVSRLSEDSYWTGYPRSMNSWMRSRLW